MPAQIRTDNEAPIAGTGLLGLFNLSLGWMKMGTLLCAERRRCFGCCSWGGRLRAGNETITKHYARARLIARATSELPAIRPEFTTSRLNAGCEFHNSFQGRLGV
jgi:hypothetical protein